MYFIRVQCWVLAIYLLEALNTVLSVYLTRISVCLTPCSLGAHLSLSPFTRSQSVQAGDVLGTDPAANVASFFFFSLSSLVFLAGYQNLGEI